eukprot:gene10778-470_t
MSMKPATLSRFAQAAALISRRCVSSTAANAAEKIESKAVLTRADNLYEDHKLVEMYLDVHYPASGADEGVPSIIGHTASPDHAIRFPQRVAALLAELNPKRTNGRALDIGCSVGGGTFELATTFDEAVGFDFSHAFIDAANSMKQGEPLTFNVPVEAELAVEVSAAHEPSVDAGIRAKASFHQGDACSMVADAGKLGTFDGAIVANLLCRLPEPLACLDGLQAIINPGGIAVIATPFSWLDEFTPKEKWLGGYTDAAGNAVRSKDTLQAEMEARGFSKVHEDQFPLIIREHQRKYQYIVSEVTAWQKA